MRLLSLEPGVVHVWYTLTDSEACRDRSDGYLALLSARERIRHNAFHFERDRHLFRVSHALVRCVLSRYFDVLPGAWSFLDAPHQRPEIISPAGTDLRFNLSHTPGLAACAITVRADVGIDVESIDRPFDVEPMARMVLTETERTDILWRTLIDRLDRFLQYWALKEAYVKARGQGLSLPLQSISFSRPAEAGIRVAFDAGFDDVPDRWSFWQTRPSERHHLAVAVASEGKPVEIRVFEHIP